jgi:hypothetical protein
MQKLEEPFRSDLAQLAYDRTRAETMRLWELFGQTPDALGVISQTIMHSAFVNLFTVMKIDVGDDIPAKRVAQIWVESMTEQFAKMDEDFAVSQVTVAQRKAAKNAH